jgi:hypothetical protein
MATRRKLTWVCALALVLIPAGSASASTCTTTSSNSLCGVDVGATAGDQFSGEVATDSGLQAGDTVTIKWGDGTSSAGSRSIGGITGSHTYAKAGTYTVTVRDPVPGIDVGVIGIGSPDYLTATATATVLSIGSGPPPPPPPPSEPRPLKVKVSGSQVYGSAPMFQSAATAPAGDSFSGTPTCLDVGDPGVAISPGLAPGAYRLDGASCSGLSLAGSTASDYTLSFRGARFIVVKAPTAVTVASARPRGGKLRFAAKLVGTRGPVAGARIAFSHHGRVLCHATTTSSGRATCSATRPGGSRGRLRYKAGFAGNPDYLAARAIFSGRALPLRKKNRAP